MTTVIPPQAMQAKRDAKHTPTCAFDSGYNSNVIDYSGTMAGNAMIVGDMVDIVQLVLARHHQPPVRFGLVSNDGDPSGGNNVISYFLVSTGNAVDFGELLTNRRRNDAML